MDFHSLVCLKTWGHESKLGYRRLSFRDFIVKSLSLTFCLFNSLCFRFSFRRSSVFRTDPWMVRGYVLIYGNNTRKSYLDHTRVQRRKLHVYVYLQTLHLVPQIWNYTFVQILPVSRLLIHPILKIIEQNPLALFGIRNHYRESKIKWMTHEEFYPRSWRQTSVTLNSEAIFANYGYPKIKCKHSFRFLVSFVLDLSSYIWKTW